MPAQPKAIDRRYATHYTIEDEFPRLPAHLKPRLQVVQSLYRGASTQLAAELAGVSQRTAQRWLALWNSRGPDALLARTKRGPRRKITREVFFQKLHGHIVGAAGEVMPVWSLAEVQRQLAQRKEIQVSYATLRRTFQRYGFWPKRPPRKLPPPPRAPQDWNYPWSPEYGTCLADLLERQRVALGQQDGDAASELALTETDETMASKIDTAVPGPVPSSDSAENDCAIVGGEQEAYGKQLGARKEGALVPASFRPYPLPDRLGLDSRPDPYEPAKRPATTARKSEQCPLADFGRLQQSRPDFSMPSTAVD